MNRLQNELGQYCCTKCGQWKDPDDFHACPTKCGKASWCKVCVGIASAKCNKTRRAGNGKISFGDYFIPTVKSNGDILLDENGHPFKCSARRYGVVYAIDGVMESNGKMKPCGRNFDTHDFTFEKTVKGKNQLN